MGVAHRTNGFTGFSVFDLGMFGMFYSTSLYPVQTDFALSGLGGYWFIYYTGLYPVQI